MNFSSPQRRALTWLLIACAAFALLWLLAPVLTPFLVGAVLAYALHPSVERLANRRTPRVLAVAMVEVLFVIAVSALMLLVVPIMSKELPLMREQIPLLAERLNTRLGPWLAQFGIQVALDTASIKTFVLKHLNANLEDLVSNALSSARLGGSMLLTVLGNLVLVPVVLFYLLMDWPTIVARIENLVPPRVRPVFAGFALECDAVLGQYLRGQLLVMSMLAVFYSVGLALFGFDLALPVGVFTGLVIFIPYLGFGLGLILALLAGALQFGNFYGLIAVAVVYGAGQVIEGFFLTPKLVGERIGMSPLTVIFALLSFGHLFGFVGVLIALPVSAVLVVAVRRAQAGYLTSRLYQS